MGEGGGRHLLCSGTRSPPLASGPSYLPRVNSYRPYKWWRERRLNFFYFLSPRGTAPAYALERGWEAAPLGYMAPLPTWAPEASVRVTQVVDPVLVL